MYSEQKEIYFMPKISKPLYDYEDVKCFARPVEKPPFWIEMAGVSNCDDKYAIFRKESRIYVCEYIIKGSGTVILNGNIYHPKAGDVYLLPQYARHEYYTDAQDPWVKVFFNVYGTAVSSMLNAFGLKDQVLFSNCEDVHPLFEQILLKTREDIPAEQIMKECSMLFTGILYHLHEKIKKTNESSEEAQHLKEFIDKNVERELSIREIAGAIYRSPDYVNRLFKQNYGITPYAYYMNLRTENAKALLQHTSLSIREIAERLGYKNSQYFSKQFRYATGMTATMYRRKNK